jgi:hypothetical protein
MQVRVSGRRDQVRLSCDRDYVPNRHLHEHGTSPGHVLEGLEEHRCTLRKVG